MSTANQTQTSLVRPLVRFGHRRMTRAHAALSHRPAIGAEAQGALHAACAALGQHVQVPVNGKGRLLPTALMPHRDLPSHAVFALIELSAAGARGLLELELPFAVAFLARFSGQASRQVPAIQLTRIEDAALSFALLIALGALRRCEVVQRHFAPRLMSTHLSSREVVGELSPAPHVGIELELQVDELTGSARLWLPAGLVQTVALEARAAPGAVAPEVMAASIGARVFAGSSVLDAADLASLRPGDAVLLDGLQLAERGIRGNARLVTTTFELRGAFADAGFVVERARFRANPEEPPMPMPPPLPIEDGASLPVEVVVELSRLRMPLAELAAIKPSAILGLHINANETVLLRVGDRAVARAELVEIDGEVGARIIALLP